MPQKAHLLLRPARVVTGASGGIGHRLANGSPRAVRASALVARHRPPRDARRASAAAAAGDRLSPATSPTASSRSPAPRDRAAFRRRGPAGEQRRLRPPPDGFLDWDLDDMERMMRVNFTSARSTGRRRSCREWSRASAAGWCSCRRWAANSPPCRGDRLRGIEVRDERLRRALSYEVGTTACTSWSSARHHPAPKFFDEEALRHMPPVSRKMMADVRADGRRDHGRSREGQSTVTFPRFVEMGYVVRAIAPTSCATKRANRRRGRWRRRPLTRARRCTAGRRAAQNADARRRPRQRRPPSCGGTTSIGTRPRAAGAGSRTQRLRRRVTARAAPRSAAIAVRERRDVTRAQIHPSTSNGKSAVLLNGFRSNGPSTAVSTRALPDRVEHAGGGRAARVQHVLRHRQRLQLGCEVPERRPERLRQASTPAPRSRATSPDRDAARASTRDPSRS